ncbi:MAG: conserved membrane protein of unknown function [Candidatus Thorarchaeota archaeon]|nr:MAG: conserved membrane protein of unknown function [Candidatus Thorarchaeota archaeon]
MIFELALLVAIYSIWTLSLVYSMVASEEVSLTVATLPFIVTFPFGLLISASAEAFMPGIFQIDILLTAVVGILLFVRWVMAIVGE